MKTPQRRRGQATVELALGSLIFVTVLAFGIHFAEVGYVSIKVTEATQSAMWDATAWQMHTWPYNKSPATAAANKGATDATTRYADFDGRTMRPGAAITLTQVFTKANMGAVTCTTGAGPSFPTLPNIIQLAGYRDIGGMQCTGQGNVRMYNLDKGFKVLGGFKANQVTHAGGIPVCAVGRSPCRARFAMMIDDWGLGDGDIGGNLPVEKFAPGPNLSYWTMTRILFGLTKATNGAGPALMDATIPGSSSMNPDGLFNMSAMTDESQFSDLPFPPSDGNAWWVTSPGGGITVQANPWYVTAYLMKVIPHCFLGRGGC